MQNGTDKDHKYFAGDHVYSGNKKEPYARVWVNIVIGLIFLVAGLVQFFQIQKWETKGGTIEMNDIAQLVYKWGGNWALLGLILAFALFFIGRGYVRYKQLKAQEHL